MGHRKGTLELSHKSKQVYLAEKILGRSVDKWLGMLNSLGKMGYNGGEQAENQIPGGKPLGTWPGSLHEGSGHLSSSTRACGEMQALPAGDESLITSKCFA